MNNSLEAIKISDKVYWVGAIDNEIRDFHGYSTSRGTTYNAFLILGKKPILVDTVKAPFFTEMMARIKSIIDPKKISYIISNHAEMDHSGCLIPTIEAIQPEQIFASKMGILALNEHFNQQLGITEIKNGENFILGDANFICLETKMLHWPDSMFTYFANDKILFTQDGFGMHLATNKIFANQNDQSILHYEAQKYFANILLPYTQFVTKLLEELPSLNLDITMMAPDHGPIWQDKNNIKWIIELWTTWAQQKPTNKIILSYDTMWNSTAKMAKSIADGIVSEGVSTKIMPLSGFHRSDIATELLDAGALLVGSPTINNQMFPTVADLFCYLKGLKRQNLIGQAFGSFGWSGESIKLVQEELQNSKIELIENPVKIKYVPNEENLIECRKLGIAIARKLNNESQN